MHKVKSCLVFLTVFICFPVHGQRPIPAWYDSAKFGIMVHWGIYSVPAYNSTEQIENPVHWSERLQSYSEWYWHSLEKGYAPTTQFHHKIYGHDISYQDLAVQFKAELFDPEQWAKIFEQAGARYVVMVAKHHDGFTLWPSRYSWNWNSMDLGPNRDLVGDLTRSVKKIGLKVGFSYSLDAWFDPLYNQSLKRYVNQKMIPQLKELVTMYEPDILVPGGHGEHTISAFKTDEFLD